MNGEHPLPTETVTCPKCGGSGHVSAPRGVQPWGTWQERQKLAKTAKAGERWIQIKSGRVVEIVEGCGTTKWGTSLRLKHENGRTTSKWYSYFGQEYTPEVPPT